MKPVSGFIKNTIM